MAELRQWQIVARLFFPVEMVPAGPTLSDRLPLRVMPLSRIPHRQQLTLGDIEAVLSPWSGPDPIDAPPQRQAAALALRASAVEADDAVGKVAPALEAIVDHLAFQLQTALHVTQLEALDVTSPVAVGETRQFLLYPAPRGYPTPKFSASVALGDVRTALVPVLDGQVTSLARSPRAALRWYVKSLDAEYDADKFILLWIALEILCVGTAASVHQAYRAPCGHEIPACPECGRSTATRVNGATVQHHLTRELGVESAAAREMWKMRQMFHGRSGLSRDAVAELSRLVMLLRGAVLTALKARLGHPSGASPVVVAGAPAIAKHMWLGGTRQVTAGDLSYWSAPALPEPGAHPAPPNVALQATPYAGTGQRGLLVHLTPTPFRTHNGTPELGR